jgi:signal transduction histidine kinase
MNDMLTRLETARAAQRRFVADASHELRSPLATITARLELGQRRGPTDTDTAEMLPEAHRMSRLIDDLLLLARADERGLAPRRDDVDLDELVEAEAARLRNTTAVRVEVDTAPVRVTGDRAQLARLLRNLTNNAARHARSRVTLRVRAERTEAILDVADDGPGIPILDRRRVFDRFVRLDEGRARETGGAGLGLAIVAEIVAAHHGQVTTAESPGGGALLHVRLPAQPDPPPTGSTSASR